MKKFKRIIAAFLIIITVCAALPAVSVSAAVAQTAYVNYKNVRIRSSTSTATSDNILAEVSYVYVTVTARNGDWFAVTYNGISGYMYATYLDFVPTAMTPQSANVTQDGVNMREQASLMRSVITVVPATTVTVTGIVYNGMNYPWYAVTYGDISGYIYGQYIELIEEQPEYVYDADFEVQLSVFPESYKPYLRNLHAAYPNWEFRADKLAMSFSEAVENEHIWPRKLVNHDSDGVSWRSMVEGCYDWSTGTWNDTAGGWTGASREVIKYYMDPRNYLNTSRVTPLYSSRMIPRKL